MKKSLLIFLVLLSITAKAQIAAISGVTHICRTYTATLSDATTGGTWSANNGRITVGSATGIITGIASGPAIITYTVPGTGYTTHPMTVDVLPIAITNNVGVCVGSSSYFGDGNTGGVLTSSDTSIIKFPSGGSGGSVTYIGVSTGTATITVTNPKGCSVITTATVNPLPDISSITLSGYNIVWIDIYTTPDEYVTVTSSTLTDGTYNVLYDLLRPDSSTITGAPSTLTMSGGTGTFIITHSAFEVSGTHTATLTTVSNANGCASTLSSSFSFALLP